jgi:hypothetical protein
LKNNSIVVLPNIKLRNVNLIDRIEILTESPTEMLKNQGENGEINKKSIHHEKNIEVMDVTHTSAAEFLQLVHATDLKIFKRASLLP